MSTSTSSGAGRWLFDDCGHGDPVGIVAIAALIVTTASARTAVADSAYKQWLEQAYPPDGPGAAAIVVKDEKVVFRGASGKADMELGVPLSAEANKTLVLQSLAT